MWPGVQKHNKSDFKEKKKKEYSGNYKNSCVSGI